MSFLNHWFLRETLSEHYFCFADLGMQSLGSTIFSLYSKFLYGCNISFSDKLVLLGAFFSFFLFWFVPLSAFFHFLVGWRFF